MLQLHIPPYEQGNRWNLDPVRRRKLLLHRAEIEKLERGGGAEGPDADPAQALLLAAATPSCCSASRKGKKTHDKRARDRRARREARDGPRAARARERGG